MNKYFIPLEFEETSSPGEPKKIKIKQFNKEKLKIAIEKVKTEIQKLADGTSKYRKGGIHFGKSGCPAQHYLTIFEKEPTIKTFEEFIQLAIQDFSAVPAAAMRHILEECIEEK